MQKINLKTLKSLLSTYYGFRIPLYLWGKPSSGKTSLVRQFAQAKAKELGLEYSEDEFGPNLFTMKVITLSQFDSPDLRGMPELTGEGINRKTQFIPTKELPRIGQGIVFFDEMNHADDCVRSAVFQYILEGRYSNIPPIKDKDGKDAFWRVAASNTEQDYSGVNQTPLALLRRFCHYYIEPEVDEIVNYLLEHQKDARVIAYLKNTPQDLFPAVWDERLLDQKANPFPYTWELTSTLIAGKQDPIELSHLSAGCVGEAVAGRFVAFCKTIGKFDIDKFIKKPKEEIEKISKDTERASLFWAVISSLASWWFQRTKKLTATKVVEITSALTEMKQAEFAVALLKMILRKRTKELTDVEGFQKLLTSLGVFFDEI